MKKIVNKEKIKRALSYKTMRIGSSKISESPFSLHMFIFFFTFTLVMLLAGLNSPNGFAATGTIISMVLMCLSILRYIGLLVFSLKERYREKPTLIIGPDAPKVTIIMPGYNEENTIESSLASLLLINYPNIEILVIDDGSTDNTYSLAHKVAARSAEREIRVIKKSNGGKASALNVGLGLATGEFILCVDADSVVDPMGLIKGLRHFNDPLVAGVGGFVSIMKPKQWILRNQHLEYFLSLNFTRQALSFFGAVTVVPGPIGLFRKSVLVDIGGYIEDSNLYAEDAELTVRLLSKGHKIVGESEMISKTQGPNNLSDLFRQRYRWKRGLYQALSHNFLALFYPFKWRQFLIGLWLIIDQVIFEIFNFGLSLFFLAYFLTHAEVQWASAWMTLLIGMDILTLILSCPKNGFWPRWIPHLMVQKISYTLILQMWGVLALLDEWFGVAMSWDKLEREQVSNESMQAESTKWS